MEADPPEESEEDQEEERERAPRADAGERKLRELFERCDRDGGGRVGKEEFLIVCDADEGAADLFGGGVAGSARAERYLEDLSLAAGDSVAWQQLLALHRERATAGAGVAAGAARRLSPEVPAARHRTKARMNPEPVHGLPLGSDQPRRLRRLRVVIQGARALRAAGAPGVRRELCCIFGLATRFGKTFQTPWPMGRAGQPIWNHEQEIADYVLGDALEFAIVDAHAAHSAARAAPLDAPWDGVVGRGVLTPEHFWPHGYNSELTLTSPGQGICGLLRVQVAVQQEAPAREILPATGLTATLPSSGVRLLSVADSASDRRMSAATATYAAAATPAAVAWTPPAAPPQLAAYAVTVGRPAASAASAALPPHLAYVTGTLMPTLAAGHGQVPTLAAGYGQVPTQAASYGYPGTLVAGPPGPGAPGVPAAVGPSSGSHAAVLDAWVRRSPGHGDITRMYIYIYIYL